MLKRMGQTVYLEFGDELIIIDCSNEIPNIISEISQETKIKKIHFFVCRLDQPCIEELSEAIKYCHDYSVKQPLGIHIYYPSDNICEQLLLHQIPKQWYTFYINLWDDVYINGYENPLQYIYYKEDELDNEKSVWGLEFEVKDQFFIYYSAINPIPMVTRGVLYDRVYCRVTEEDKYQSLCDEKKVNESLYERFYIISDTEKVSAERIVQDHFHSVDVR